MRRVVWFSCGAASAVAAKLTTEHDPHCEVVYCDTSATEHPDNLRFLADVERWIQKRITIIKSEKYASVDEVIEKRRYMAGPKGALCTVEMKKVPRFGYQLPDDIHIFGFTADEPFRVTRFKRNNPELTLEWPLMDRGIDKALCYEMVGSADIELPALYRMGYEHNNCLGCVKATSPAYWNSIRRDFPEVFDRRCRQSRALGVKLTRVGGVRTFLDELPIGTTEIVQESLSCGPECAPNE